MTAVAVLFAVAVVFVAALALVALGYEMRGREIEARDMDAPHLSDVQTGHDADPPARPLWLPVRRFVARRPDDPRRLLSEGAQTMRETARRRAGA